MTIRTRTVLTTAALGLSALLAGCSTSSLPPVSALASGSDSVLTVLQPGAASDAQLERQYGGVLVTRTPDFALFRVNGGAASLAGLGANTTLEKDSKVFRVSPGQAGEMWGSGSLGLWGNGSLGLWGNGSLGLWGNGSLGLWGNGSLGLWGNGSLGLWGNGSIGIWGNGSIGIWGNGSIGIWGNGSIGIWGNGSIGIWGNSLYQPVPQNTGTWRQIGLDSVQAANRASGEGMTVAIVDTGVDLEHPAYRGRLTAPSTWRDFVSSDDLPQDEGELGSGLTGHGTEIAGIIAQVAPAARIMPLRVLDTDGSGDVSSVSAAIVWAVNHGANVINLSLGAGAPVKAVSQAIAYANKKGVTVVAAAGNAGTEGMDYPAAQFADQPMNLSVGSVSPSDAKSSFSQYGAALELLAPGEGVFGPAPQNRLVAWSGTSMSAPMVSAALALGMGKGATGTQAAAALTSSATPVNTLSGNAAYGGKLGSGRLNLDAAMSTLGY